MTSSFRALALAVAVLGATLITAEATGAQESPEARAVLARAKEAAGGSAWDALTSLHTKATIRTGGLGGSLEWWEDLRTGRGLSRFTLGPYKGAEGFDGKVHWSQDPSGQARREEGQDELLGGVNEAYRRCLGYWYPDRWPAEVAYEGPKEADGRRFEGVSVVPRGGRRFEIWVDAGTGLIDHMVEKAAVETRTTYLSDYHPVRGVRVPHAIRSTNGETRYDQLIAVDEVLFEVDLPDELFRMPGPPPVDYRFSGARTSTRVPFELVNHHIYLDVRLNGKGPFRFLCDTGGANVVTPTLARELGLRPEGALQGRGVGEKSEDVGLVKVDSLTVGDVTLRDQLFAVFALESFGEVEGVPQFGLIGYEVFKRFVVAIDYENLHLTLTEPAAFAYAGDGATVPFKFNGHIPQVEGSIGGIPGLFDLDTGSRSSLSLLAPFVEKHGIGPKSGPAVEAVTGWGVGGPARARVVRMGPLRLGPVEVTDVVTNLSQQTRGAFIDPYVAGNVGTGVLKRFNLLFDYGRQIVVFEPNRNAGLADVYDRSGMWINGKEGEFEVMDVTAGGPAEAAGLRVGDRILAVDGLPAPKVGLVALRERFRGDPPGTGIRLRVRGSGKERDVTLRLREMI